MAEPMLQLPQSQIRKLLSAANADAALLYLYLRDGGQAAEAETFLHMSQQRVDSALALLYQLGLQERPQRHLAADERPVYTQADVERELGRRGEFERLTGEVQRILGKVLSTQELTILLSLVDYLGLSTDVVGVLVSYCREKNRHRGVTRLPSIRMIEREAYSWADQGIDTIEAAVAYIQHQQALQQRTEALRRLLGLTDRRLTPAEQGYLDSWVDAGFADDAIALAYERTCLNTGSLKWAYMNKILKNWHAQGLHTRAQVESADDARQHPAQTQKKWNRQYQQEGAPLSAMDRDAIARMLAEQKED